MFVGGFGFVFVFVSYFSQSSEIPDQTSSVSCGIVNFLAIFPCLFHRSTSQLVLDIVWHFFRPT